MPVTAAPECQALLDACAAAPEENTPRLVLADWLDEHGEGDRALLIRKSIRYHELRVVTHKDGSRAVEDMTEFLGLRKEVKELAKAVVPRAYTRSATNPVVSRGFPLTVLEPYTPRAGRLADLPESHYWALTAALDLGGYSAASTAHVFEDEPHFNAVFPRVGVLCADPRFSTRAAAGLLRCLGFVHTLQLGSLGGADAGCFLEAAVAQKAPLRTLTVGGVTRDVLRLLCAPGLAGLTDLRFRYITLERARTRENREAWRAFMLASHIRPEVRRQALLLSQALLTDSLVDFMTADRKARWPVWGKNMGTYLRPDYPFSDHTRFARMYPALPLPGG